MGVDERTYGMLGFNLPYGKETEERIKKGLGLTDEMLKPHDGLVDDYLYKKGFHVSPHKRDHVGTYRYVSDGMSGEYIRVGLVLFESDEYNRVDYYEIVTLPMAEVQRGLKENFGLEGPVGDLKFFVFTHYT